jgi:hypothetical protein
MEFYKEDKYNNIEQTQIVKYIAEVFKHNNKILSELRIKLNGMELSREQKEASLALQSIANIYFQFEQNDLNENLVEMVFRIYLSNDLIPIPILKDFLYYADGVYMGIEKEYAIKEMLIVMYKDFYKKYDEVNNPEVIKDFLNNIEKSIIQIKSMEYMKENEAN